MFVCVEIDLPKDKNFVVCVVYRPPNSDVTDFLDDLESLMLTVNSSDKSVCFMGDFNIDLLSNSPNSIRFQNILDSNASLFNNMYLWKLVHRKLFIFL